MSKRGRPKINDNKRQGVVVSVRMTKSDYEKLVSKTGAEKSKAAEIAINSYIEHQAC